MHEGRHMTWMKGAVSAIALVSAGLFAMPAAAQTVYDPLTTRDVTRLLQSLGYESEIENHDEENEGDYVLSKIDDVSFWIHFTACDEDGSNCEVIVFDAGFSFKEEDDRPDLAMINEWNEYSLGKAGLDDEGDPYINIEINIVGGVTRENLADTVTWWKTMIKEYTDFIGWG
jgi:hypothetical protein